MNKLLIIILILGLFLRVVDINNNPRALYGDELTLVYDAYSILKTGSDQKGNFLPITFEMAGGRPGGYVYATVPFVAILGPTTLAARAVSILSGLGIIFLLFFLGRRLFNQRVGLISSLLAAISPWSLSLSRGGFESHFALFLTLLGITTFIEGLKRKRLLIISGLSFGIGIHTYSTYKLTIPLIVLLLIWFVGRQILNSKAIKFLLISLSILGVFGMILIWQIIFNQSERRFLAINAFNQEQLRQQIIQKINLERQLDQSGEPFLNFFHNKFIEYSLLIGKSYFQNFSTDFLFLRGDGNPRHNPAESGQLYFVELVTILFGLLYLVKNVNKKIPKLLIFWILLSPIPAALLLEPHALRNSLMLPPLLLISAAGLIYMYDKSSRLDIRVLKYILIFGFVIQFIFIIDRIYFLSPNKFSRFWSNPAKIASNLALQEKNNYKYVILSDRIDNIEFAYPVYAKLSPELVIAQNKQKTQLLNYQFNRFDNVYVGFLPESEIEEFINNLDGPTLYIGTPNDKEHINNFETINDLDNSTALTISKINK